MENKNDLMLNIIANPSFSLGDFVTIGFNSNNTSLQDKDFYRSKQSVQNFFSDEDGKFNEKEFNNAYNKALSDFNLMSTSDYTDTLRKQINYHRSNIMAPVEQRRQNPDFKLQIISNPERITNSVITLGKSGERTKSRDELAQSNQVLLNPKEVEKSGDWSKARWGKDPHSGFFDYFTDTLVMAQYDEDGTHIDPITNQEIEHKKGDLKINQNGTYYYEKLDGRDIYGRRVLNKMNVLTEEGSTLNKYDFFDSDDLKQKNIIGTTMKNLALVGTMFLPYVGPAVAGISIATQLAGLGATLGKMLIGSESPTLSAIEGWSKSLNRQGATSEYAQEHTWCWENFINLIGDVAGQLKEQRFIFEKIPIALKGSPEKAEKLFKAVRLEEFNDKELALARNAISKGRNLDPSDIKKIQELQVVGTVKAQADFDSWFKGYQKIGEVLSKGYMTAITVGDTYGEAKEAGASDLDATLLTLGYAAGEYAILNTGIGEWILPELRANRYKNKAIIKALTEVDKEAQLLRNAQPSSKKEYVKRIFNIGKKLAREELGTGRKTLNATIAAGIGEGVEEVSEELLADFSKGCYNVVNWLRGNDVRMNSFGFNWEDGVRNWNGKEIIDRYGMSLIGGAVGGSLTNLGTNYKYFKDYRGMDRHTAIQEVVKMTRNGELSDLVKQIDKTELDNSKLSYNYEKVNEEIIWKPGDSINNRDTVIKNTLKDQLKLIENILNAEGANLSDDSFLDKQTLSDLRFNALYNSVTAGDFIQEFNNLSSEAVKLVKDINQIALTVTDTNKDGNISDRETRNSNLSDQDKNLIRQKEDRLKEVRQQIKDLTEGKRADEFIGRALFEMTSTLSSNFVDITFPMWCKAKFGKDYKDISNADKNKAREDYKTWLKTDAKDKIRDAYVIYRTLAEQSSSVIKTHEQTYLNQSRLVQEMNQSVSNLYRIIQDLQNVDHWQRLEQNRNNIYTILKQFTINIDPTFADRITAEYNADIQAANQLTDDEKSNKIKEANIAHAKKLDRFLADNFESFITPFINQGFANVEVKNQLSRIIQLVKTSQEDLASQLDSQNLLDGINPTSVPNEYRDRITRILELNDQLQQLNNTPFEQNYNQFAISIGQQPTSIIELIKKVNQSFNENAKDISAFNMEDTTLQELDNTIFTLQLYKASILGARTDNVNLNDLYGYNATLNEVSKKVGKESNLAEIDSQFADVLVADIDNNLNKLEFLRQLYEVNQGQKLNKQNRVGIKSNALVYKRMKQIVQILKDDDELKNIIDKDSLIEFSSAIDGLQIHNQIQNDLSLTPEEKFELEKEKIKFDDSIYNFFNKNSNLLNDEKLLSKFINPKIFDLYTNSEQMLNEDLDAIDDVSMIWYIAARAAVKASDFYSIYKDTIDPQSKIIPIATQEMAIYETYANIVNGDTFTRFVNAYKNAIKENWKNTEYDDRIEIFKKLGKDLYATSDYLDPEYDDFCLNFLPCPKYTNIVFTEGIPGSGKTKAILAMVIKLLEKTDPKLIENIAYIHGADLDPDTLTEEEKGKKTNAEKLKDSLTRSGSSFDKYSFLRKIIKGYTSYAEDGNGNVVVPDSGYYQDSDGQYRGSYQISESTENVPSLIVIDEVTKFNNYELDAINDYARKHGLTVVVLGDYDQEGVSGYHDVIVNNKKSLWTLESSRNDFIRSPKLGVSMRTDNLIKSRNLARFQSWMTNPNFDTALELHYYQDETGIYGDKVYDTGYVYDIVEDVRKLIATLKPDEKIGFIYSSKDSELYKALNVSGIKEHLDLKPKGIAQGSEARYYIIDGSEFNLNKDDIDSFKVWSRQMYTGMSRAGQGSIIVTPYTDIVKSPDPLTENLADSFGDEAVISFVTQKKEMLNDIVQGETPKYVPRTKEDIIQVSNDMNGGLEDNNTPRTQSPNPQPAPQPPSNPQPASQPQSDIIKDFKDNYEVGDIIEVSGTLFGYNGLVQIQIDTITDDSIYGTFVKGQTGNVVNTKIEDLIRRGVSKVKSKSKNMTHQDLIDKYGGHMDIKSFEIEVDGKKATVTLEPIPFENDSEKGVSNIIYDPDTQTYSVFIRVGNLLFVFSFDSYFKNSGWEYDGTTHNQSELSNIIIEIQNKLNNLFKDLDSAPAYTKYTDEFSDFLDRVIDFNDIQKVNQIITEEFDKISNSTESPIIPDYDQWWNDFLNTLPEEPSIEDSFGPDSNERIPNTEEEYKEQIETSNPKSKDDIRPEDSVETILFHTFNTLELGASVDTNGNIIDDGNWSKVRIDGINGLRKADQIAGKTEEYTVENCLKRLALIQGIILNNTEKAKICEDLENLLGINGIFVNFALKATPPMTEQTKNDSSKNYVRERGVSKLGKNKNEHTYFNNSKDTRSGELNAHQFVAIIRTRENGDFLEVPLFTMTSPFTYILARKQEFPQLASIINQHYIGDKLDISIHELTELLSKEISNLFNSDPNKYKTIKNLLVLFKFNHEGLFRVFDPKNPTKYSEWTIGKVLKNLGPQMTATRSNTDAAKRGNLDLIAGMEYDASLESNWMTVSEYNKDPRVKITPVLKSLDGVINGKQVLKKGHPFVLISYNPYLRNNEDIINQFIKQQEPNYSGPIQVIQSYILAPSISLAEYIETLDQILSSKKEDIVKSNYGNLFTPLRIIERLSQGKTPNFDFMSEVHKKIPEAYNTINNILIEVGKLGNDNQAIKEYLLSKIKWNGNHKVSVATYLGRIITAIAYDKTKVADPRVQNNTQQLNITIVKEMQDILNNSRYKIFYDLQIESGRNIGPFAVVQQDYDITGQNPLYKIDGKDIQINGKIDSYVFKGDIDELLDLFVSKIRYNVTKTSADGQTWVVDETADFYIDYKESKSQQAPETLEPSDYYVQANTLINKVKNYIDLEQTNKYLDSHYTNQMTEQNLNDFIEVLINNINLKNSGIVAFKKGNDVLLSPELDIFKDSEIINFNGQSYVNLVPTNSGKQEFDINVWTKTGETITYKAEYDHIENQLKITYPISIKTNPMSVLTITPNNFNIFKTALDTLINPNNYTEEKFKEINKKINKTDMMLKKIFNCSSFEEFIEILSKYKTSQYGRSEFLRSLIKDNSTLEQKQFIEQLALFEEISKQNKEERKQENENSCPSSILINLM